MSEEQNGIWSQWQADQYHSSSPKLAKWLVNHLDLTKVIYDFGAGRGFYLNELAQAGAKCIGMEGFHLNNFMHDDIRIWDLTRPFQVEEKGIVLSFETMEHLPEWAEKTFLDSVTNACDSKLIFSCATPGQPGQGHINCRSHEYVIAQIEERGFKLQTADTLMIRKNVDKNCDWLERNLLVFTR